MEQEGTKAVVRAWLKQVGDRGRSERAARRARDRQGRGGSAGAGRRRAARDLARHGGDEAVPGAMLGRIAPVAEVGADAPSSRRRPGPSKPAETCAGPTPASPARRAAEIAPLALGEARRPPARSRSRPISKARAATGASPAPTSTARSRQATRVAKPGRGRHPRRDRRHPLALRPARPRCASPSPRTCSARSPRRRTSPRCSRRISRAIIAHRASAQGGLREEGREAHLLRLSSSPRRPRR